MAGITNSPMFIIEMFMYALAGGVLPALLWLWFWMHEGHEHKEPRHVITLTFLFGMCAVFLVYPFQRVVLELLPHLQITDWKILALWAFLEETIKLVAVYILAFRTPQVYDEPIDAFVYLVTAALGFAAMENTFFLLRPLLEGDTIGSIMTGNLRFMGANLLHIISSGVLSLFIASAYYKKHISVKFLYAIAGLIGATLLHTLFNFFIISSAKESIFLVFSFVWISTILLILALERIKLIKNF